jgi:hypothetical protein
MSIMPLLPTRLVSNIKFKIYTKKAWESYIFARPDAQALACSPVKIEKHAEAHAYMATSLAPLWTQRESCLYTQASTAASHDLGFEFARFERQSKR